MALVTKLKQTLLRRTVYQDRDPVWVAAWVNNGEESGYSAYNLRTLLKEVLKIQGKENG
jgi:hypothetical protein